MSERKKYIFYALILGFLTMIGPISIDTFLPMVPSIAKGLNVSIGSIEFSLTAIFTGNAIGQIIYGPVSDRFGRRPIILIALFIFFIATIGAGLSTDIETLVFWRFLQGLMMASGRILANSVARDLYEREKLAKLITTIMLVGIMSSIGSAPLGGFLSEYYSWHTIFWFMAIYSGIAFLIFFVLFKETIPEKDYRALKPSVLFENFSTIITNHTFLLNVICGGFILSGLVTYLNSSSGVLIGAFGIKPALYGLLYATVMVGYASAAITAGKLMNYLDAATLSKFGAFSIALGGICMLVFALTGLKHAGAVLAPMIVFMVGFAFLYPQTISAGLMPFPEKAGTASSLQGFLQNLMAAIFSAFLAIFADGTAIPMGFAMAICGISAAATYMLFIRRIEHQ
jgi:DHA1 family bicyclomycin/chloramphenicol resistance-like MFS transporter